MFFALQFIRECYIVVDCTSLVTVLNNGNYMTSTSSLGDKNVIASV